MNISLILAMKKPWIRIRIRIDLKCLILIRTDVNTDPKHRFFRVAIHISLNADLEQGFYLNANPRSGC